MMSFFYYSDYVQPIEKDDLEQVRKEVELGADIERELYYNGDGSFSHSLQYALIRQSFKCAAFFIEIGAELNITNFHGYSPLMTAVQVGSLDMVRKIALKDGDVNFQDELGWSPLHFAAYNGDKNIIAELISNMADVSLKTVNGLTPADIAASCHNHQALYALQHCRIKTPCKSDLLTAEGSLNSKGQYMVKNPSFLCEVLSSDSCSYDDKREIFRLVKNKIPAADREKAWNIISRSALSVLPAPATPATPAASAASAPAALVAADESCLPSVPDDTRPADKTSQLTEPQENTTLITNPPDKDKLNSLLQDAFLYKNLMRVKQLAFMGADFDVPDENGRPMLISAIRNNNTQLAEFLITSGVNLNVRDSNGNTPLMVAGRLGRHRIFKLLLEHGADITLKNNAGKTAKQITNKYGQLSLYRAMQKHEEHLTVDLSKISYADLCQNDCLTQLGKYVQHNRDSLNYIFKRGKDSYDEKRKLFSLVKDNFEPSARNEMIKILLTSRLNENQH